MTCPARLRIVFFGVDGIHSREALTAIAAAHQLVGVVRPVTRARSGIDQFAPRRLLSATAQLLGLHRPGSLAAMARSQHAPLWEAQSGDDPRIATEVRALRPDVICLSGYPWLLRGDILTDPPALTLNVHAALLPRHRGPLPLFWIYHADDRQTGVTVHAVTSRADAGDILGQESFPLPRGFPVEQLNRLNAERGAKLLLQVLGDVAAGRHTATPQDEALATPAPRVRAGTRMIDFDSWEVERVWHFCAGLFPRFIEPLTTGDGTSIRYGGALGYDQQDSTHRPGTVTTSTLGYHLHCRGGIVRLSR